MELDHSSEPEGFWKVEVGPDGSDQWSPGLTALCFQDDLMHTIGVSAALGAAGVVLWGDLSISSSEVIIAPATSTWHSACVGVPGSGRNHGRATEQEY